MKKQEKKVITTPASKEVDIIPLATQCEMVQYDTIGLGSDTAAQIDFATRKYFHISKIMIDPLSRIIRVAITLGSPVTPIPSTSSASNVNDNPINTFDLNEALDVLNSKECKLKGIPAYINISNIFDDVLGLIISKYPKVKPFIHTFTASFHVSPTYSKSYYELESSPVIYITKNTKKDMEKSDKYTKKICDLEMDILSANFDASSSRGIAIQKANKAISKRHALFFPMQELVLSIYINNAAISGAIKKDNFIISSYIDIARIFIEDTDRLNSIDKNAKLPKEKLKNVKRDPNHGILSDKRLSSELKSSDNDNMA